MITMRSISKSIVLSALAAMTFTSLATSAQAYDGHRRDGGYRGHAPMYSHPGRHYRPSYHAQRDHRRHDGDKALRRGLAIGLGVAILGGILAAESNKSRVREYYE